jgi:HEAT repeat protein
VWVETEFGALVSALRGGPGKRYDAVVRLCAHGEPAIAYLLRQLREGDTRTRYSIVRAFTGIGWPPDFEERADVAEALFAALHDEHAPVRHRAARALERCCEPRAAAVLVHWLTSDDAADRYRAQSGLHCAGVAALCRAVDDPAVEARRAAVAALARLRTGHRHTTAKMRDRLANDPDDEVRGAAAKYLAAGANEPFDALKLLHATVRNSLAGYWTRLGALEGITRIATDLGASRVLSAVPDLPDALEATLSDRWVPLRFGAVKAVAAVGGPRAADMVSWMVYDRDEVVRAIAVSALVTLRAPGALATARTILREDPHYLVRESAARSLAEYAAVEAADALRAGLNDVNEHVRLGAIGSLAVVAGADALDDLRAASLSDTSAYNRDRAAELVARLAGARNMNSSYNMDDSHNIGGSHSMDQLGSSGRGEAAERSS